jgi:predicted RNA methylase
MRRTSPVVRLALGVCLIVVAGAGPVGQTPATKPDVVYVPTPQAVVDAMLQLADVKANDVVYDLGSGDGRIVITAARKYGARGVGIEIDPALVETSRRTARDGGVDRLVQFAHGDLFDADLSSADVVMLYLSASINASLEPKLRRELKRGARIVSHQFPIGRWPPDRTVRAIDGTDLYLWTIGQ